MFCYICSVNYLFFPGTTTKEIELKVVKFLNKARDRSGGRLRRGLKKTDVSIEDRDDDSNEGSEEDTDNNPQQKNGRL